jgi:hypothetical protein
MSNPYAPKKRKVTTTEVEEIPVEATSYEVPEGSVSAVMKWVDGDVEKAKAAYEVESKEEKPRVSLIGQLEELIDND